MTDHRLTFQPGRTFFVTVALAAQPDLGSRSGSAFDDLVASWGDCCVALSLLPGRLHAVWVTPGASRQCAPDPALICGTLADLGLTAAATSKSAARWARRWRRANPVIIRRLRSVREFHEHVDLCHFAPVRHGLVPDAEGWAWSTIHTLPRSDMLVA